MGIFWEIGAFMGTHRHTAVFEMLSSTFLILGGKTLWADFGASGHLCIFIHTSLSREFDALSNDVIKKGGSNFQTAISLNIGRFRNPKVFSPNMTFVLFLDQ